MNETPKLQMGIQQDVPAEIYHAQTWAVSNSDLKVFGGDSPAHYLAKINGAKEDDSGLTDDERKVRVMGQLAHIAILEPNRFGRDKSHYVKPLTYIADEKGTEKKWNGNAKVCEKWMEEHQDLPIINEKEERRIIGSRDAVLAHPVAGDLVVGPGSNEVSVFAKHPATGLDLRMRADRLTEDAEGRPWVVDLKSCPNVDTFVKSARDFYYDQQAVLYSDVLALAGVDNPAFCFIAFELAPRFDTTIAARARYEAQLHYMAECRRTNVWPLGNEDIQLITVKRWTP